MCAYSCPVPIPKKRNRRAILIVAGLAGVVAGSVLAVLIVLALTSDAPPSHPPQPRELAALTPEQLFEKASPAVVYIVVRDKSFSPVGLGSGFFVDANGLLVTNYHVVQHAEFATVRLGNGATLFVEGVTAIDRDADLALLKVSGEGYPHLKNADGALPRIGSPVYAIGNPHGLKNTFSAGMVSGHREIKKGLTAIQTTTPISRGSSGGALLNANGEVLGVTTAYLAGGQNLNFAVAVAAVRRLIRNQGKVRTLASAGGGLFDKAETEELDKAWAAMAKEDWSTATTILTALRKRQNDSPFVWSALGYLHARLGNHQIAIQHYKRAIALKPEYAAAYWFMGLAYRALERYTEAIAAYKQAIALKPDFPQAYFGMAVAYEELKRYTEAIAAYKQAIAINPDDAFAYFGMGAAYEELGQYAAAVTAYEQYLRLEPTGPAADAARDAIRGLRGR